MRSMNMLFVLVVLVFVFHPSLVIADKAAAVIQSPESAQKGTEVAIKVTFTHAANSSSHFIEWAKVMVNGKEVARWDFTRKDPPEAAKFTKEVKLMVDKDLEVTAQASCNKHGSRGPAHAKIAVK
jgi:desulfoferrodoxin (superoxide reductase-like protein)